MKSMTQKMRVECIQRELSGRIENEMEKQHLQCKDNDSHNQVCNVL